MANVTEFQITEEGPRNAVVKLTGVLDTSDVSITPAISLSEFTNNDVRMVLWGLRVDMLEWSMSNGLEINLTWNSIGNPQQIFPLAGRGRIAANNYGGFIPDKTRGGFDGSINLVSKGFAAGTVQNYTIILELVKLYTP